MLFPGVPCLTDDFSCSHLQAAEANETEHQFHKLCPIVLVLLAQRVFALGEHEELVDAELGDHVYEHGEEQIYVRMPVRRFQCISPPCGQRCEHTVVDKYLYHGQRNVGGALEGEVSVESEVPDYGTNQGNEVAWPVFL